MFRTYPIYLYLACQLFVPIYKRLNIGGRYLMGFIKAFSGALGGTFADQ